MGIDNCFGFDELINCNSPAKNQSTMFDEANTTQVNEIMNVLKEQRSTRQINEKIILATPRKTNKPVPNLFSPPRELPKQNIKDFLAKKANKSPEIVVNDTIDSENSDFIDQSQKLFKDPESSFDTSVRILKKTTFFIKLFILL